MAQTVLGVESVLLRVSIFSGLAPTQEFDSVSQNFRQALAVIRNALLNSFHAKLHICAVHSL